MREIRSLNNDWFFTESFNEKELTKIPSICSPVRLPHTNKILPLQYFDEKSYQFISTYYHELDIQDDTEKNKVFIDFEGVMTAASVYINSKFIYEHKGGYTPFTVEINKFLSKDQKNILAVKVDSTERSDIPPFGNVIDYLTFGGMYREVSLRVVPNIYVANVFAKPLHVLEDNKELNCKIFIANPDKINTIVNCKLSILDSEGSLVSELQRNCDLSITETGSFSYSGDHESTPFEITIDKIANVKLWDIDNPSLYTVKAELLTETGEVIDTYTDRFGFKEAKITGSGFYLNGKRLVLRGLNRHQSYPYSGYAMPASAQRQDAVILKNELKVNCVRTSHYPQSKAFLDACDELGLLVLEEIPGWQHIGNAEWKDTAVEHVREMITRDWNRASIFMWGVRINESKDDNHFYKRTNALAHELDSSRQTGGIRFLLWSKLLEDVYTFNDFSHGSKEFGIKRSLLPRWFVTRSFARKPYLITENNGHMYPTKRYDQEERVVEHALRHARIHNATELSKYMAGAFSWCMFDYNTHYQFGSGDRICYHGVMDMFRIPKFASYFYSSQSSPKDAPFMKALTYYSRGERAIGGVVPLVVFTNCDYVDFLYAGKSIGRHKPDKKNYKGLKHPPIILRKMSGQWGCDWDNFELKGYVDGKEVMSQSFSKNPLPSALVLKADTETLTEKDTYDTVRITVSLIDQMQNLLPFAFDTVQLAIEGVGEIIGPTTISLQGGTLAFWVKTVNKEGTIKVSAIVLGLESNRLTLKVNKA